jgi:virginiamycin B lyase
VPTPGSQPEGITAGSDGNLWFTESAAGNIGRATTAGTIVELPVPTASWTPDGITTGADGNLWFTEFSGDAIGRVSLEGATVLVLPSTPTPNTLTIPEGHTPTWMFVGPTSHSVADASGMNLFDSGPRSFVSYFPFRFVAAGNYAYTDSADGATGHIAVKLNVAPATGTTSTVFTVTFYASNVPTGFVLDAQVQRPGSASWTTWKSGWTARTAKFTPDAGAGTYHFRSRLRRASNNAASGWSPTASITVS